MRQFQKTRIFEQTRNFIEGKWRKRKENGDLLFFLTLYQGVMAEFGQF